MPSRRAQELYMAETVHLFLKINNQPIAGESTQTSLGRAGSIECIEVVDALSAGSRDGVNVELRLVKHPDSSTPALARALIERATLAGQLRYYRPHPAGDGTTQHYLTVTIAGAKLTRIERRSPDVCDPATATRPVTEELTVAVGEITWTWNDGGQEATAKPR